MSRSFQRVWWLGLVTLLALTVGLRAAPAVAQEAGTFAPITKTANVSEVFPGDQIVYTITVQRTGDEFDGDPIAFQVVDTAPEGLNFLDDPTPTCDATPGVTCFPADVSSGTVVLGGSADPTLDFTVTFTITAVVDSSYTGDEIANNACLSANDTCASAPVTVLQPGNFEQVVKTADPTQVFPGDSVAFTINVPWTGGTASEGSVFFQVTDEFPEFFIYQSFDCTGTNATCNFSNVSDTSFQAFANVIDGTSDANLTVTLFGFIDSGAPEGTITNQGCQEVPPPSETRSIRAFAQPAANCGSASVEVVFPVPGSFGQVTKVADPTEVERGDTVTYTIGLPFNGGTDPNINISAELTDPVPTILTDVSWTCSGTNVTCDAGSGSGNDISISLDANDPTSDGSASVVVTGVVVDDAPAGPFTNTVTVEESQSSPPILTFFAQPVNSASATVTVVIPAPTVVATITPPEPSVTPPITPTEPANGTPIVPTTIAATEVPGEPTTPATLEPTTGVPADPPSGPSKPGQPPVTNLPNTGAGDGTDGFGVSLLLGALALILLTAVNEIRRSRRAR